MDNRVLTLISRYQPNPEELLNCCKQFSIEKMYDLRCKDRIYFRDGMIKVMNCTHSKYSCIRCKEIWYKEGKRHRDDLDPETGLTLPAYIRADGTQFWWKDGVQFTP